VIAGEVLGEVRQVALDVGAGAVERVEAVVGVRHEPGTEVELARRFGDRNEVEEAVETGILHLEERVRPEDCIPGHVGGDVHRGLVRRRCVRDHEGGVGPAVERVRIRHHRDDEPVVGALLPGQLAEEAVGVLEAIEGDTGVTELLVEKLVAGEEPQLVADYRPADVEGEVVAVIDLGGEFGAEIGMIRLDALTVVAEKSA